MFGAASISLCLSSIGEFSFLVVESSSPVSSVSKLFNFQKFPAPFPGCPAPDGNFVLRPVVVVLKLFWCPS